MNEKAEMVSTEDQVKHTPGPWRLNWHIAGGGQHSEFPCLHYVCIEGGEYGDDPMVQPLRITGYIKKADAYLLSAAPDLLALAKQLASECCRCGGNGVVNRQIGGYGYGNRCAAIADVEAVCPDCEDIRVVIAKAEGR